jgi:NAD(P)-dependent dehydrogenase (short-subunit alcohol dehydrogenase family)
MHAIVWFVTGASRGFGLEIARAALARGNAVVAAARDLQAVYKALGEHERLLGVAHVAAELSAWREVALSTEYHEPAMEAAPHGAGNRHV